MNHTDFYTKTMAKVYADQGHLEKAAEIYRYLLRRYPEREDIIGPLSKIEKKLSEKASDKLVLLFAEWIELAAKHNSLKKLKKLEAYYKRETI